MENTCDEVCLDVGAALANFFLIFLLRELRNCFCLLPFNIKINGDS